MSHLGKKELEEKIEAYKRILSDLSLRMRDLDTKKAEIQRSIENIKEFLNEYENQLFSSNRITVKAQFFQEKQQDIFVDTSKLSIAESIKAVLKKSGNPMHVKDLTNAVISGGKKIDSKNTQNVIYATLTKRKKWFTKVGPNIFELKKGDNLFE